MKFVTSVFCFCLLATGLEGQSAYRDYPVPYTSILVKMLNDSLSKSTMPYRITSQDVIQRIVGGQTTSYYGRFTYNCGNGSTADVHLVTSTDPDGISPTLQLALSSAKLLPVRSVEKAYSWIDSSSPATQLAILKVVAKYSNGACIARRNPDYESRGYYLTISLWLSASETDHEVTIARVSRERFEALK